MGTDEKTDEKAPPSKRDKLAVALAAIATGAALLYTLITGQALPSDHVCECPEVVITAPVGINPEVPDPELAAVPVE